VAVHSCPIINFVSHYKRKQKDKEKEKDKTLRKIKRKGKGLPFTPQRHNNTAKRRIILVSIMRGWGGEGVM
jgi:hypothetical protein